MATSNPFTTAMAPMALPGMPADMAVQNNQLLRSQQLAELLRKQSLEPSGGTEMVSGWAVKKSPMEGVAKLAQALGGRYLQDKNDEKQLEMSRAQAEALGRAFGLGGAPAGQEAGVQSALGAGAVNGDVGPTNTNAQRLAAALKGDAQTQPMYPTLPGRTPQQSLITAQAMGMPEYMKLVAGQLAPSSDATRARELGVDVGTQRQNYDLAQQKAGYIAPINAREGSTLIDPRTGLPTFNAPKDGMQLQYDKSGQATASQVPGYIPALAAGSAAKASGPAQFKMITVDTPDGPKLMTEAQAAALSGGGTRPSTPSSESQMRSQVSGPMGGDAAAAKREIAAATAQLANVKDPASRKMLEDHITDMNGQLARIESVPKTGAGIDLQSDESRKFGSQVASKSADALLEGRDKAKAANDAISTIGEARKAIAGQTFQGTGADTKLAIAKFVNANIPGVNINVDKVANTDYLKSTLGAGLLAEAKTLGSNPSNADATRINDIVGSISKDPQAMQKILDWREDQASRVINNHNKTVDDAETRGLKSPYDLRVKGLQKPGAKNPIFEQADAILRGGK